MPGLAQGVKVGGHVLRLIVGKAQVGHRCVWLNRFRMLYPESKIAGRVGELTGNHGPSTEEQKRWTNESAGFTNPGNHVASPTTRRLNQLLAVPRVSSCGDAVSR